MHAEQTLATRVPRARRAAPRFTLSSASAAEPQKRKLQDARGRSTRRQQPVQIEHADSDSRARENALHCIACVALIDASCVLLVALLRQTGQRQGS